MHVVRADSEKFQSSWKLLWNTTSIHYTFQRIDNNESSLVKLFPIPVHQDIPCELLDKTLKVLSK